MVPEYDGLDMTPCCPFCCAPLMLLQLGEQCTRCRYFYNILDDE